MMTHITWEQLVDYVEGRVEDDNVPPLAEHLDICLSCASEVAWLRQTLGLLKEERFPAPPLFSRMTVVEAFDKPLLRSWSAPPQKARQAVLDAFEQRMPRQAPSPEPKRKWYQLHFPRLQWGIAFAFAAILMIALFSSSSQRQPTPFRATVEEINGVAQLSQRESTPQPLTTDLVLSVGDYLTTDEESQVKLAFGDAKVTLLGNSRLGIKQIQLESSTLSLLVMETDEAGTIEIATQGSGQITLHTPHGTLSTDDGTFRVQYLARDEIAVTVMRGEVHISNAHGSIDLQAGKRILLVEELPPILKEEKSSLDKVTR